MAYKSSTVIVLSLIRLVSIGGASIIRPHLLTILTTAAILNLWLELVSPIRYVTPLVILEGGDTHSYTY